MGGPRVATVRPWSYDGWPQSTTVPHLGRFEGVKRKSVWGHIDRKRASKGFSSREAPCGGAA